jgi:hypothetical protein
MRGLMTRRHPEAGGSLLGHRHLRTHRPRIGHARRPTAENRGSAPPPSVPGPLARRRPFEGWPRRLLGRTTRRPERLSLGFKAGVKRVPVYSAYQWLMGKHRRARGSLAPAAWAIGDWPGEGLKASAPGGCEHHAADTFSLARPTAAAAAREWDFRNAHVSDGNGPPWRYLPREGSGRDR